MNKSGPKPKPFECPENIFWYLVGLVATDGCLSKDGRHVDITSVDREYLMQIRAVAGLKAGVFKKTNGRGGIAYRIQPGGRDFYQKLLAIGLTPRKSLTIGPLSVPDAGFGDFLRGVIDGDGNIRKWKHPTNGREQWRLFVCGASRPFIRWLSDTTSRIWQVNGRIHVCKVAAPNHHPLYVLKYGKLAAKVILTRCYYPGSFALERKRKLADGCIASSVGWSKSKTVEDKNDWRGWQYRHIWIDKTSSRILDSNAQRSHEEDFVLSCG